MTRSIVFGATLSAALLPGLARAQDGDGRSEGAAESSAIVEPLDAAESEIVERVEKLKATVDKLEAEADARREDPKYFFDLGNAYADLAQREKAIAAYESALALDGDYVEVLVNLGSMQNETGKADEAIAFLERAAEIRPSESKVWVNLGNAHYSKSDYYGAVTHYRKALEVDPSSYEAYYQFAVAFADAAIYREAIRLWQKVVDLAPESDAARSAKENIEVVEQILSRRL